MEEFHIFIAMHFLPSLLKGLVLCCNFYPFLFSHPTGGASFCLSISLLPFNILSQMTQFSKFQEAVGDSIALWYKCWNPSDYVLSSCLHTFLTWSVQNYPQFSAYSLSTNLCYGIKSSGYNGIYSISTYFLYLCAIWMIIDKINLIHSLPQIHSSR